MIPTTSLMVRIMTSFVHCVGAPEFFAAQRKPGPQMRCKCAVVFTNPMDPAPQYDGATPCRNARLAGRPLCGWDFCYLNYVLRIYSFLVIRRMSKLIGASAVVYILAYPVRKGCLPFSHIFADDIFCEEILQCLAHVLMGSVINHCF